MKELILASASQHRANILRNAGLRIEIVPAEIDERLVEQPLLDAKMGPDDIAEALAIAKALDVSARQPGAIVIGCDQTLGLDGTILHKPADMEAARRRLLELSGRTHTLNSAISIACNGEVIWSTVEVCTMTMRKLEPAFVGRHLAMVGKGILSSVGAYQVEGPGIQLFEKIEGDLFSVIGLPLLQLLKQLRIENVIE